ncbi:hypothetical protein BpHYR1_042989 [Brachionus plicatilis]|uniref:Uncharacterized protein n=1 Tax=Brachionus plicatilis TaxID=10195 RepID=A0A3M7PQ26_BRAPC|nr:hypothetical protein BpHYR1_042989 [Brachionus plicatilis]
MSHFEVLNGSGKKEEIVRLLHNGIRSADEQFNGSLMIVLTLAFLIAYNYFWLSLFHVSYNINYIFMSSAELFKSHNDFKRQIKINIEQYIEITLKKLDIK